MTQNFTSKHPSYLLYVLAFLYSSFFILAFLSQGTNVTLANGTPITVTTSSGDIPFAIHLVSLDTIFLFGCLIVFLLLTEFFGSKTSSAFSIGVAILLGILSGIRFLLIHILNFNELTSPLFKPLALENLAPLILASLIGFPVFSILLLAFRKFSGNRAPLGRFFIGMFLGIPFLSCLISASSIFLSWSTDLFLVQFFLSTLQSFILFLIFIFLFLVVKMVTALIAETEPVSETPAQPNQNVTPEKLVATLPNPSGNLPPLSEQPTSNQNDESETKKESVLFGS